MASVRHIMELCIQSGTVRRFIYTASACGASPLKDDGSGFRDSMDETCWTPLNFPPSIANFYKENVPSKMLAEKEVLSYQGGNLEVITIPCGAVTGDTLLPSVPPGVAVLVSQIKSDHKAYRMLRSLEELVGKIAVVHIDDVVAAHIFCIDNSVPSGRYLCANGFLKTAEIAAHYLKHHPGVKISQEFLEDTKRDIRWGSSKLQDLGFQYKYDAQMTLGATIQCAKRTGYLNYMS